MIFPKVPFFSFWRRYIFFLLSLSALFLTASLASAAISVTGTGVTGDSNVIVDGSGSLSIGTSTATSITIGRTGVTTTILGNFSLSGYLLSANNLSDLTSTSTARISLGLSNLANALQLIAANNLSDLTNTSTARTNLGFSGGTGITISGTGTIGLTTSSISQFTNDTGYVTSTVGSGFTVQTDVTASRAFESIYHNTSSVPIYLEIMWYDTGSGAQMILYSDSSTTPTTEISATYSSGAAGNIVAVNGIVLPGNYYEMHLGYGSSNVLWRWVEVH